MLHANQYTYPIFKSRFRLQLYTYCKHKTWNVFQPQAPQLSEFRSETFEYKIRFFKTIQTNFLCNFEFGFQRLYLVSVFSGFQLDLLQLFLQRTNVFRRSRLKYRNTTKKMETVALTVENITGQLIDTVFYVALSTRKQHSDKSTVFGFFDCWPKSTLFNVS